MAYRKDDDLIFLSSLKSEDLDDLVYILTHDTDGEVRITEEMTANEDYKKYCPDHHMYWSLIASEIQCFGANTIMTLFRGGEGVLYREVLTDVCDKLDISYSEHASIEQIEDQLLEKILKDTLAHMSAEDLRNLSSTLGIRYQADLSPHSLSDLLKASFSAGGILAYQITLVIVGAIMKSLFGRGSGFIPNKSPIDDAIKILISPIAFVITGIWTMLDIAGPAFRVTVPAVIQVACLRKKHLYSHAGNLLN